MKMLIKIVKPPKNNLWKGGGRGDQQTVIYRINPFIDRPYLQHQILVSSFVGGASALSGI